MIKSQRKCNSIAVLFVGVFVLVSGLLLGGHDVSEAQADKHLLSEGVRTVGTVADIHYDVRTNRKNRSEKTMIVSYIANDGNEYSVNSTIRYNVRNEGSEEDVDRKFLNTERTVFYNPANPSESVVEDWEKSFIGALLYGGTFVVLGSLGIIGSIYFLKPKRSEIIEPQEV